MCLGKIGASAIGEIRVAVPGTDGAGGTGAAAGFYDFTTKYLEDAAELSVPADIDGAVAEQIRALTPVKDIIINYVGPVIGAHTGPGVISVFFVGTHR